MIDLLYDKVIAGDEPAVDQLLAALHHRIAAHFALAARIMRERRYRGHLEHDDVS